MKFYHVTTPKRAQAILKEGFNENKNPTSHTGHSKGHRLFLCRKRHIQKWIRILSKEQHWKEITIIVVKIPNFWYRKLINRSWKTEKNYICDWGDQLVFDTENIIKEGMYGIRLSILS